jgi:hypothetical protein
LGNGWQFSLHRQTATCVAPTHATHNARSTAPAHQTRATAHLHEHARLPCIPGRPLQRRGHASHARAAVALPQAIDLHLHQAVRRQQRRQRARVAVAHAAAPQLEQRARHGVPQQPLLRLTEAPARGGQLRGRSRLAGV